MKRSLFQYFLFFFLLSGFLFFASADINTGAGLSPSVQAQTGTEPDALAVRVLPNTEHADPLRWYKDKGMGGNPTRLTIDGYNAVRDGRTVYVNVGNVVNGNFYTNIYVLSYTQDATANTVEIFNRLLKNFDFNTNLIDEEDDLGYCAISTQNCVTDEDCSSGYKCSDNRKCIPREPIRCYRDIECPQNIYCDSNKAEVLRDTERLAQMREIERLAEEYKRNNDDYPKLEAGTYLPGKTISVWPSWEDKFQNELASVIGEYSVFDSLPEDPINRLSRCSSAESPQYNQVTCWDETDKVFAGSVSESSITLPTYTGSHPYKDAEKTFSSHAYTYAYGSFNTCTPLETQGVNVEGFGVGSCSVDSNISTQKETTNNPPTVDCGTISAHPDSEFSKYIQASDPDNDPIVDWEMETIGDWSSWSSEPELRSSGIDSYREIYASQTGEEGRYEFNVSVTDSQGASSERICEVVLGNTSPSVSFSPCDGNTKIGGEYYCNIEDYDPDGDELDYDISGLPSCLEFDSGILSGTCNSGDAGEYTISITVSDGYGKSDSDSFDLRIETYCGDQIIQTPNMRGGYEECDEGGSNGEACEPSYNSSCTYCDSDCQEVTLSGPGNCGDGVTQPEYGEECDAGPDNGEVCYPPYDGSCTYCKSNCKEEVVEGGSCGDGTVQRSEGEECESGGGGTGPDDQYSCNDNCQWADGYCGDEIIQSDYDEDCDEGSTNGDLCNAPYSGSCTYCNSDCDEITIEGGYCGDGTVQEEGGEECEFGGGGTGPDDQHDCTDDYCQWTGGWCGDGTVNSSYEDCDIEIDINEKRTALEEQGVSNVSNKSDAEVEAIYDGACSDECVFQCTNWDQAGSGCYIGGTCEKGTYKCNASNGNFECQPFDSPKYDYCCESMENYGGVSWGQNQLSGMSITRVKPSAASTANSESFYCDDVCKDQGKICVGVGVTDDPSNYCKAIRCHAGSDCALQANQDNNDCRTEYPYTREGSSNMCTNPETYNIGYTSCLCY